MLESRPRLDKKRNMEPRSASRNVLIYCVLGTGAWCFDAKTARPNLHWKGCDRWWHFDYSSHGEL
jgi:hypothetical protein